MRISCGALIARVTVVFLDTDDAMGKDLTVCTIEKNVAQFDIRRRHGSHCDKLSIPDGRVHAVAGGTKPHALALAKKLSADIDEQGVGHGGCGIWYLRSGM